MTTENTAETTPNTPSPTVGEAPATERILTRAERRRMEENAKRVVTFGELPRIFELILGQERQQLSANQSSLHALALCMIDELEVTLPGFKERVSARMKGLVGLDVAQEIPELAAVAAEGAPVVA